MHKVETIHYTSDFQKAYRKLPQNLQERVDKKNRLFRESPFHSGLHTHKLSGPLAGLWSFRVTRNYRVLFEFVGDKEAIFYDVGTHEIYR